MPATRMKSVETHLENRAQNRLAPKWRENPPFEYSQGLLRAKRFGGASATDFGHLASDCYGNQG